MATSARGRHRLRWAVAVAAWAALTLACPLVGLAAPASDVASPPSPTLVPEGEPWWLRVAFSGNSVTAISVASSGELWVAVGGHGQVSSDGGRTFRTTPTNGPPPGIDSPCPPHLGEPSPLVECAVPAALPGVVVGVDVHGVVWRRDPHGDWGRGLLLLPSGGMAGVPRVTAVTAFADQPDSVAVYVGTDGYAVLESGNGGDDWIRDDPGLPPAVLSMATDSTHRAVYAGTADGLWVHHLRANPAPPAYPAPDLRWRRLATALVALATMGIGLVVLAALGRHGAE